MEKVADKKVLVAADIAGYPLKEAVINDLKKKGWEITDIGVTSKNKNNPEMFHRIGFRAGSMISEKKFERALLFCGTGMGIHIAASKCPHVHAAVVESVPAALRAITGNNCNVLAMGSQYISEEEGIEAANAFLNHYLGDGYENWKNFKEFHELAFNEIEEFNYNEYKKNGYKVKRLGEVDLEI